MVGLFVCVLGVSFLTVLDWAKKVRFRLGAHLYYNNMC